MFRNKQARKARLMTAASILTLALVALPFEPSLAGVAVDGTAAQAKGKGGGNGGGKTEAAEGLTVAEDPADTEETEVVDTETTETTETVQSRSISQATEDAVVAGFLARDSSLGETEVDGTIDVSETTPEDDGAIGDGSGPDETIPSS